MEGDGGAAEGGGRSCSLLQRWFGPPIFRDRATVEAAAREYEQAVDDEDSARVRYNVETAFTAGGTERGGVRMPARDFMVATSRLRLDNNEPVYVTARWRWAADLETSHLARPCDGVWVEQRSLRFGDPLDPPENIMIVDRPWICQKPYM